jgi:hypothetical protein
MRLKTLTGLVALTLVAVLSGTSRAPLAAAALDNGPALESIGTLAFGADGTLFAADTKAATIYAIDLGAKATGTTAGARSVDGIDQQIASLLGTDAKSIAVADMVIHPKTKNAYLSVMRGQGADAKPALLRVDGAGKLELVALDGVKYTKVTLPNAPNAGADPRRDPRRDVITHMALVGNKLYVAGLSNEEFASKLRAIPYPFTSADKGTSVEIFHGNHGQLETRSPVYAFIPYTINNEPYLIASYLCTPLVKFPVASLKGDAKVLGTTIAELGNGNQPIDMVLYKKDGHEFLLMANTRRGVMKIPTDGFATLPSITSRVATETAGIKYETIQQLKGIVQLDLLDASQSIVLAKTDSGALNLQTVALP